MRFTVATALAFALALFSPLIVLGEPQAPLGQVFGTVVDRNGATVPNATVTLVNLATQEEYRVKTNNLGEYVFSAIPPGRYKLRAVAATFGIAELEIDVAIGGAARTNLVLNPPTARGEAPPPPPAPLGPSYKNVAPTNYVKVKIFYATDRQATGTPTPDNFYADKRGSEDALSYGTCEVSIPRDHRPGELEEPSIWKLEFRPDPEKHIVLLNVTRQERASFFIDLAARVQESGKKEVFVFIHGYNVTFKDAARRTAQLAYDLHFDGAPILYSWPSKGTVSGYLADEATVTWTTPHLKAFLLAVAAEAHATAVHLIAHSMGNRALTDALRSIATEGALPPGQHFRQVILAAPDIDAGVFRQLAQSIEATADRVTLYSSSKDEALAASRRIHDYPRAGESGPNVVIVPGIDTIDVSAIDTGLLAHSYYGDNRSVISDIIKILQFGLPPNQRSHLTRAVLGTFTYWVFSP